MLLGEAGDVTGKEEPEIVSTLREIATRRLPDLSEYDSSAVVFRALRTLNRRGRRPRTSSRGGGEAGDAQEMMRLYGLLSPQGRRAVLNLLRTAVREEW